MGQPKAELSIMEFRSGDELRAWLLQNHATSAGIWVRIYNAKSGVPSLTFEDMLDEGLCFGWSESNRRTGDERSYLQCFTPRRSKGTTSKRNLEHAARLIREKKMTPAGLKALGLDKNGE